MSLALIEEVVRKLDSELRRSCGKVNGGRQGCLAGLVRLSDTFFACRSTNFTPSRVEMRRNMDSNLTS